MFEGLYISKSKQNRKNERPQYVPAHIIWPITGQTDYHDLPTIQQQIANVLAAHDFASKRMFAHRDYSKERDNMLTRVEKLNAYHAHLLTIQKLKGLTDEAKIQMQHDAAIKHQIFEQTHPADVRASWMPKFST